VDIAIAGTLSFANDGAITLANTTGSASGNGITTTTAQYMVIRITGTQTVTKVITGPSYSKLYMVDHAGATSAVTFKAAGQTGVTVAVGEKCFVYYNGTDYVKVASSVADGVTTISFGSTGLTPSTATSGAVTVAGTLAIANGGTGTTSTTFANLTTNVTGTLPVGNGGTGLSTLTANNVILGNGTSTPLFVAPSTTGNVLTSNGTTWTSTAPAAGGTTIPSGTVMLFAQTAAPTGFTKLTTHNDKALRVVSGAAGTGGSVAFTTAFGTPSVSGSVSVSGTVGATTLTTDQIPSHTHNINTYTGSGPTAVFANQNQGTSTLATSSTGGGNSHDHSFSGSGSLSAATATINVAYVDIILATKD
jgi:hypothetical protein